MVENPTTEDLTFLEEQINTHNVTQVGAHDYRPLAAFVRDEDGEMIAGISGYTWAGFCEIRFLWVHESVRKQGYGSRLLVSAEREARARGCRVIILSSYSFQAPDFYRRHGYETVGSIEDCPPGYTNVYLKKQLQARRVAF